MPYPIFFGEEEIAEKNEAGEETKITKLLQINNPNPAWIKSPSDLKEEDYKAFYNELYPYEGEPLFWIHLNTDSVSYTHLDVYKRQLADCGFWMARTVKIKWWLIQILVMVCRL